jgi:hypothetical protein
MSEYFNSVLFAPPKIAPAGNSIKARCPDRLMECFESLGDGCEFGNVQRFCGIEPLGLLRFASLPYPALIRLLDSGFSNLPTSPAGFRLLPHRQDREWWIAIDECGMYYHTGHRIGAAGERNLRQNEAIKIQFLKRKILEELAEPQVIFVRRDPERSLEDIRHAYRRLTAFGPQDLLWISRAPAPEMEGDIELLEPGLVRGFIGDTGRNAAPPPAALATWLTLAEKTLETLKPALAAALRDSACPHSAALNDPVWRKSDLATTLTSNAVPTLPHHHHIWKHALLADTDWDRCEVLSFGVTGLVPEAFYTVSAHVWLPAGFDGEVCLMFPGVTATKDWPANPARREGWQRIATSIRMPDGADQYFPSLCVKAARGTHLFSTAWRFDEGAVPADCF